MTTMRQGIGGAPRLRCPCWPRGGRRRRRATSCCSTVALRARAPGPSARAVVRPCSAVACAGPDAGGQEARTVAGRGVLLVLRLLSRERRRCDVVLLDSRTACSCSRAPTQGGQWSAGSRPWSVAAIDRPERREGNGAPRVPVATQERERPSVTGETCCSTAALRVRAPGHQHRAADGRRVPAMGRVSQSTGLSGEKGNGAPRVPVAEAEAERCRRDVLLDCRSLRSCSRA